MTELRVSARNMRHQDLQPLAQVPTPTYDSGVGRIGKMLGQLPGLGSFLSFLIYSHVIYPSFAQLIVASDS